MEKGCIMGQRNRGQRKRARLGGLCIAAGLLALALPMGMPSPPAKAERPQLGIVRGTPLAKDFALPDLEGKIHHLRAYRGKVVVLNFWATWCPPCRHEIPSMQRAHKALLGRDVVILAVHVGGSEDKVFEFLADFDIDFTILLDKRSKITSSWPFTGLPTTFIIAPDGRLVYRAIGGRKWDDPALLKQIQDLLKKGKGE